MAPRKIVSLSLAICFIILMVTGVLSYFRDYSRVVSTLHTVFGFVFIIGVALHLINNIRPLKTYLKGKSTLVIFPTIILLFSAAYFELPPFKSLMDAGARLKAQSGSTPNTFEYEHIEMSTDNDVTITIDLLRSTHYWHPQMAVWIEDIQGNFIESLYVTKATARGLFYGGRTKENFKDFDIQKHSSGKYRRVNALPVWSHKRGVEYEDGIYVPTPGDPLPDAITGATLNDNFKITSSIHQYRSFIINIEINVAFDDNEYYSEFDFPEDEIFHNGTGQLGQPSIIFQARVNMDDEKDYYLMDLVGHGHHSGQSGQIYEDLSGLTTALEIVERIVVGVRSSENSQVAL